MQADRQAYIYEAKTCICGYVNMPSNDRENLACIMMVTGSSTLIEHTKIQADALNKVQDIKTVCSCDRMQGKTM